MMKQASNCMKWGNGLVWATCFVTASSAAAAGRTLGKDAYLSYAPTETAHDAPAPPQSPLSSINGGFSWIQRFEGIGWAIEDISIADGQTLFAAAELGKVLKTGDGGDSWTTVLNLGFPFYWYGVNAFDPERVVISGFNNQTGDGIIRWTLDGGQAWSADVVLLGTTFPIRWLDKILFVDDQVGIALVQGAGVYLTNSGGRDATDWNFVQADPERAWFMGNFTFRPDGKVWISGINFCHSADYGGSWECRRSIDPIFDGGGVSFPDLDHGWVGGGTISPEVRGWVHRTTDGGITWSNRILDVAFPIRAVLFLDSSTGFAVGGNVFSGVGGIYSTSDGGDTWTLDVNTGAEMRSIRALQSAEGTIDVWCAGYTGGSFTGRIYKTQVTLAGLHDTNLEL